MSDVLDRVKRIVVDRLGVEEAEVSLEASFKDDLALTLSMSSNWSWNWKMSSIWRFLMKMQRKSQLWEKS